MFVTLQLKAVESDRKNIRLIKKILLKEIDVII